MQRIMVAGGASFIGSYLFDYPIEDGLKETVPHFRKLLST